MQNPERITAVVVGNKCLLYDLVIEYLKKFKVIVWEGTRYLSSYNADFAIFINFNDRDLHNYEKQANWNNVPHFIISTFFNRAILYCKNFKNNGDHKQPELPEYSDSLKNNFSKLIELGPDCNYFYISGAINLNFFSEYADEFGKAKFGDFKSPLIEKLLGIFVSMEALKNRVPLKRNKEYQQINGYILFDFNNYEKLTESDGFELIIENYQLPKEILEKMLDDDMKITRERRSIKIEEIKNKEFLNDTHENLMNGKNGANNGSITHNQQSVVASGSQIILNHQNNAISVCYILKMLTMKMNILKQNFSHNQSGLKYLEEQDKLVKHVKDFQKQFFDPNLSFAEIFENLLKYFASQKLLINPASVVLCKKQTCGCPGVDVENIYCLKNVKFNKYDPKTKPFCDLINNEIHAIANCPACHKYLKITSIDFPQYLMVLGTGSRIPFMQMVHLEIRNMWNNRTDKLYELIAVVEKKPETLEYQMKSSSQKGFTMVSYQTVDADVFQPELYVYRLSK